MSSDPRDSIERLINESVKLRRAQLLAELPMPGPMRARLHDAISAKARQPQRPAVGWRFVLWLPAVAAAVVILICGLEFMARQRETGNGSGEHPGLASRCGDGVGKIAMNQRFSRVPSPDAVISGQDSVVLSHFQVTRSGNRIEVVDADGSVYAGEIRAPMEHGSSLNGKSDRSDAGTAISFHAAGANRTLNQRVEFEGQYIAPPPAEGSHSDHSSSAGASGSRIFGSAKVGESLTLQIEAVPLSD